MNYAVVALTAGVTMLAELPDKSMLASLVLGSRHRALHVVAGTTTAFLVHVVIAVTAGGLLARLPERPVQAVIAVGFLVGAAVLFAGRDVPDVTALREDGAERVEQPGARTGTGVAALAFTIVFVGEWGDVTQISTANLAARYADPVSVGAGALIALWSLAVVAATAGRALLTVASRRTLSSVAAVVLLVVGAASAVGALA